MVAWESTNTSAIVEGATGPGATVDRYIALSGCWLGMGSFDARLDVAVRNWGRTDPAVRERLDVADEERVAAFVRMIEPEGHGTQMTLHRAPTMYYMQMGWFELGVDQPLVSRIESSAAYFEVFIRRPPTRDERATIETAFVC